MMRTKLIEEKLRQQRLNAKTLDSFFRRQIEEGANCSPFVSAAILQTVKDVYPLSPEDLDNPLGLGQIKLLVVAAHEPAGKSLEDLAYRLLNCGIRTIVRDVQAFRKRD